MLSNQEVVDFVTQRIGQAMEPEDICEELMTRCAVLNLVHIIKGEEVLNVDC